MTFDQPETGLARMGHSQLAVLPGTPEFEQTASGMAQVFRQTVELLRLIGQQIVEHEAELSKAFPEGLKLLHFRLAYTYNKECPFDRPDDAIDYMKRAAWRVLADKLGIKNCMSVKRRREFDSQLETGELPDITEETITATILGLIKESQNFAKEAAKEVFDILLAKYSHLKTNTKFRIGRRVILHNAIERWSSSNNWHVNHYRDGELRAIDGVFHLMDGRGLPKEGRGPLVDAVTGTREGTAETDFFKLKMFKNGNLHIEMRRLDLVKELNFLGTGERVLGEDLDYKE